MQDIDDVAMGHDHLAQAGKYEHMWGLGRHVLGSQVYDYWADPWGRVHEHWADSDRLNSGQRLEPGAGRGGARLAMGRDAVGEVHQHRQPVGEVRADSQSSAGLRQQREAADDQRDR